MSPRKMSLDEARKLFLGDDAGEFALEGSRRKGAHRSASKNRSSYRQNNKRSDPYAGKSRKIESKESIKRKIEALEKRLMFGDISQDEEREILDKIAQLESKL